MPDADDRDIALSIAEVAERADLESALGVIEFRIASYGGGCLP